MNQTQIQCNKKHQILGIIESSESWCPGSNPGSTAKLNLFE